MLKYSGEIYMAKSLDEMAADGKRKMDNKVPSMKANYDAAKPMMKRRYGELPFGPQTTDNYNKGVDAAEYRTPDTDLWKERWIQAMRR